MNKETGFSEILDTLGIRPLKSDKRYCPFCQDATSGQPKMYIYNETDEQGNQKEVTYCHKCATRRMPVEVVRELKDYPKDKGGYRKAYADLEIAGSNNLDILGNVIVKKKTKKEEKQEERTLKDIQKKQDLVYDIYTYFHFLMDPPIQTGLDQYWENRGIRESTLRSFDVKVINTSIIPMIVTEMDREWGTGNLVEAGISIPVYNQDGEVTAIRSRLGWIFEKYKDNPVDICVIPYFTGTYHPKYKWGNICGFKLRIMDPGTKVNQVWIGKPGLLNRVVLNNNNKVCICEGESDTMTLHSFGIPSVGVSGCMNFKPEWASLFIGKKTIIIMDGDDAGRKGAEKTMRILRGAGVQEVVIIDMPEGYDVNRFFLSVSK